MLSDGYDMNLRDSHWTNVIEPQLMYYIDRTSYDIEGYWLKSDVIMPDQDGCLSVSAEELNSWCRQLLYMLHDYIDDPSAQGDDSSFASFALAAYRLAGKHIIANMNPHQFPLPY